MYEPGTPTEPVRGGPGPQISAEELEIELDIVRIVFAVLAAASAVALLELLRWLFGGVGERFIARHPFIAELVMEGMTRPWRR